MWIQFKQWLPILSISLTAFLLVTSELIPIGILNQISADLATPPSQIGLMISIPSLMAAVSAILFPFIFKKFNRQFIFISLTIIMIISNLLVYVSHDYPIILFGRLIIGIAIGGFATLSITSCRLYTPDINQIATAISIVIIGMTLATVLGLPFGIWISHVLGWRQIFLIISLLSLVLLIIQLKFLPQRYATEVISFNNILILISNSQTRIHIYIALLIFLAHFICYSYISVLFERVFSLTTQMTALLLCIFGVSSILGNFAASRSKQNNVDRYLVSSFFIFCLSLGLILSHLTLLLYIACVLWGLAFGVFSSAINIFITYQIPKHIENGMPLFIALIQLTIMFGSFSGGFLLNQFGINSVFISSFVLFALCTFCYVLYGLKETEYRDFSK